MSLYEKTHLPKKGDVNYDKVVADIFGMDAYTASIDALVEFAHIPSDASVLELCCGTGISSRAIFQKTRNLVAVELNPKRMRVARQKLPPGIQLLSINAHELDPQKHGTYDYLLCINGFHYFEPDEFYAIAARMLHPQGKLVFNVKLHDYNGIRPLNTRLGQVVAQAASETDRYHGPTDIRDGSFLDSSLTAASFSVKAPFAPSRTQEYALYHSYQHIISTLFSYWGERYVRLINLGVSFSEASLVTNYSLSRWAYDIFSTRFHSFIGGLKENEYLAKAELFVEATKS